MVPYLIEHQSTDFAAQDLGTFHGGGLRLWFALRIWPTPVRLTSVPWACRTCEQPPILPG